MVYFRKPRRRRKAVKQPQTFQSDRWNRRTQELFLVIAAIGLCVALGTFYYQFVQNKRHFTADIPPWRLHIIDAADGRRAFIRGTIILRNNGNRTETMEAAFLWISISPQFTGPVYTTRVCDAITVDPAKAQTCTFESKIDFSDSPELTERSRQHIYRYDGKYDFSVGIQLITVDDSGRRVAPIVSIGELDFDPSPNIAHGHSIPLHLVLVPSAKR